MHVKQVAYLLAVLDVKFICTCDPHKLHVKNNWYRMQCRRVQACTRWSMRLPLVQALAHGCLGPQLRANAQTPPV